MVNEFSAKKLKGSNHSILEPPLHLYTYTTKLQNKSTAATYFLHQYLTY